MLRCIFLYCACDVELPYLVVSECTLGMARAVVGPVLQESGAGTQKQRKALVPCQGYPPGPAAALWGSLGHTWGLSLPSSQPTFGVNAPAFSHLPKTSGVELIPPALEQDPSPWASVSQPILVN